MKIKSMDLSKLKSIIKKEAVTANIIDQVKDDVRVYKIYNFEALKKEQRLLLQLQENLVKLGNK